MNDQLYDIDDNKWIWDNDDCGSSFTKGALCMKGTPDGPNGWIFTQSFSTQNDERFDAGSMITENEYSSGAECCQRCGENRADTASITFGHQDNQKCYCINELSPATCTGNGGGCKAHKYVSGPCTLISSKKKRDVNEIQFVNNQTKYVPSFFSRKTETKQEKSIRLGQMTAFGKVLTSKSNHDEDFIAKRKWEKDWMNSGEDSDDNIQKKRKVSTR